MLLFFKKDSFYVSYESFLNPNPFKILGLGFSNKLAIPAGQFVELVEGWKPLPCNGSSVEAVRGDEDDESVVIAQKDFNFYVVKNDVKYEIPDVPEWGLVVFRNNGDMLVLEYEDLMYFYQEVCDYRGLEDRYYVYLASGPDDQDFLNTSGSTYTGVVTK